MDVLVKMYKQKQNKEGIGVDIKKKSSLNYMILYLKARENKFQPWRQAVGRNGLASFISL